MCILLCSFSSLHCLKAHLRVPYSLNICQRLSHTLWWVEFSKIKKPYFLCAFFSHPRTLILILQYSNNYSDIKKLRYFQCYSLKLLWSVFGIVVWFVFFKNANKNSFIKVLGTTVLFTGLQIQSSTASHSFSERLQLAQVFSLLTQMWNLSNESQTAEKTLRPHTARVHPITTLSTSSHSSKKGYEIKSERN